jgi:polyisoprenyl-teichoic acid--peptidoglycan teichoic acid transferase
MKKKKKRNWKIISYSILGVALLIAVGLGLAYYQLLPKNHFQSIPVVSSGKSTTEKPAAQSIDNPIFNVLLIGSDQRKGQRAGHSDSMILVHVDLKNNKFQSVSIPRDTRVHLDGYGYTKLTSVQYIIQSTKGSKQGIEAAVKAVGELTGVPINYYVETNYWGFQSLVDSVGGINMNVPFDVKLTHPWYKENRDKVITAGSHFFNGKMVTEIVHERYSLTNGEYGRQQLQQEALKGIAKQALSSSNISKLPALVDSIPNFIIATNMSNSDMLSLGLTVKDFDPSKQLVYHQLHGTGKKLYDDILKAKNDQIVIEPQQIKDNITAYFQ